MKKWWRRNRARVLSGIVYAFVRFVGLTLRLDRRGLHHLKGPTGKVVCGWHGKSLIPANFFKGRGVWALFSLSNDGELQSKIFMRFGFQVIRGSTGRGGARAAIEAIRVLRSGETMAITPDGPRGPSGVVQGGVMLMAQKSGAALVPVGSSARWRILAGSWDRYMIPLPFSKAMISFGEPVFVHEDATEEQVEALRLKLQTAIHALERECEKAMGHAPGSAAIGAPQPVSSSEPAEKRPAESA